mgnify:FL=1
MEQNLLFGLKEKMKITITILAVFGLIIAGYAINSRFVLLAWLLLIFKIVFSRSAEDTLIPYIMVVTWGAEIWGVAGSRSYTILKLLSIILFLVRAARSKKLKYHQIVIKKNFFVFFFLFISYVFLGIINYNMRDLDIGLNLALCYLVIYYAGTIANCSFLKKSSLGLAYGVVLSAAMFYIAPYIPRLQYVVNQMIQTTNIYGFNALTRLSAMAYDPNQYGLYVIIAMTALLRCLFLEGFKDCLMIALCLILAILGVLTLSKSYLIIFAFLFIVFSYRLLVATNIRSTYKILIILLLIIAGVVAIGALSVYINAFTERFNVSSANDLTTGRSTIWLRYIEIIFGDLKILLMGSSVSYSLPNYSSPHNFILYMIFHFGIVGSMIYIGMIFGIFDAIKVVQNENKHVSSAFKLMPFVIYMLYSMTIDPFLLYDAKIALLVPVFIAAKDLLNDERGKNI